MTGELVVLSWNVQGEIGISERRMDRQLRFLEKNTGEVDCFLLQAVNWEGDTSDEWLGQLGAFIDHFTDRGFSVIHSGDWAQACANSTMQPHAAIQSAHNRCNLTASRWPIERRPLELRLEGPGMPRNLNYYYSHFPEKILVGVLEIPGASGAEPDRLEVWNVGVINGANWGEEKVNMLETIYGRLYLLTVTSGTPVVLGGDFNAPKRETADGTIIPHGANKGRYTNYPYYGHPHSYADAAGETIEFSFDRRWQLAERRIFDSSEGEWQLDDAYWNAASSPRKASTEDYTHVVSTASPANKRLDHILVSEEFRVQRCEIWNGLGGTVDGFDASDHAPVFARLELGIA